MIKSFIISKIRSRGCWGMVPYRGGLSDVIFQLIGGLRPRMGYAGCRIIKELWETRFIQITNGGLLESHPHGVFITKEPLNYSLSQII